MTAGLVVLVSDKRIQAARHRTRALRRLRRDARHAACCHLGAQGFHLDLQLPATVTAHDAVAPG